MNTTTIVMVAEVRTNTRKALDDGNLKEILESRFGGKVFSIDHSDVLVTIEMSSDMFLPFKFMQKKRNGGHKKGAVVSFTDFLDQVVREHGTQITPEQAIQEVTEQIKRNEN